MKEINFNNDNLLDSQIDKVVKKVRGIVINKNTHKVLLVHYAGLYMFPGGSISSNETEVEALKREILEESGIEVTDKQVIPFLVVNSYDKNYFDRKDGVINRLTKTMFFCIDTDKDIDMTKRNLTENEIEKNCTVEYVDLSVIRYLVETNITDNSKREQFDREILTVLDEILSIQESERITFNDNVRKLIFDKK